MDALIFWRKIIARIIVWKFITIKQFMDFFYSQTFTSDMFLTYSVNPVKHLEYILHCYSLIAENHANILKRSKLFKMLQSFNRSFLWNKYITDTNVLLNTHVVLRVHYNYSSQSNHNRKLCFSMYPYKSLAGSYIQSHQFQKCFLRYDVTFIYFHKKYNCAYPGYENRGIYLHL